MGETNIPAPGNLETLQGLNDNDAYTEKSPLSIKNLPNHYKI